MAKSISKKMTTPRKKSAVKLDTVDNSYGADNAGNYSSSKKSSSSGTTGTNYANADFTSVKEVVQQLLANPTVRYIAAGLATTLATKLTAKLTGRYPQISTFMKESFPNFNLDEKIRQFKDGQSGGPAVVAH